MDVHAAAIRSANLLRYLSEAHALSAYGHANDWRTKTALEELESVADALGFDLVKRADLNEPQLDAVQQDITMGR
jgi:hypothetical protein